MELTIQQNCPGLRIGDEGLIWRDAIGRDHVLGGCARLTIGEVATRLRCDENTIYRRISAGEIYPVARFNQRAVEVFEVAVTDYIHRATLRPAPVREVSRA